MIANKRFGKYISENVIFSTNLICKLGLKFVLTRSRRFDKKVPVKIILEMIFENVFENDF